MKDQSKSLPTELYSSVQPHPPSLRHAQKYMWRWCIMAFMVRKFTSTAYFQKPNYNWEHMWRWCFLDFMVRKFIFTADFQKPSYNWELSICELCPEFIFAPRFENWQITLYTECSPCQHSWGWTAEWDGCSSFDVERKNWACLGRAGLLLAWTAHHSPYTNLYSTYPSCILCLLRIKIHLLISVHTENKSLTRFQVETIRGLHLLVRLLVADQSMRLHEHSLPCSSW